MLETLNSMYTIQAISLQLFREGGCCSYIVFGASQKYFLKVVPGAFLDTINQSLNILVFLEERGFPSPRIIPTIEGLLHIEVNNTQSKTIWVLFDFIEGSEPSHVEDIESIGELVGQLHSIMRDYTGELSVRRKEFFIDRYITILNQKKYDKSKIVLFEEYGEMLWKRVEKLPIGFCHGDLHTGNLLKSSAGKLYLLDFDTSCHAFPTYDIMIMCNSTNYFEFNEKGYLYATTTYEAFLKGYLNYCTLSSREHEAFYDLIAIYHYQLQATIIEIYGLDCVDDKFLDKQLDWLMRWRRQCEMCG